jgi:AraC-like DNA-binding protein
MGVSRGRQMGLLIDTSTVPPDHRIEAWSDVTARSYHPVAINSLASRPYAGRMARFELGTIWAFLVAADPNTVLRTPRGIAMGDPERLDFYVMRRGRCRISQDDRSSTLAPGDMSSLDSSRPYVMRAMEPFELISFSLPKVMLRAHADAVCKRTAVRIPGDSSLPSLMAPFLCGLVDRLHHGEVAEHRDDLSETVFGLLRALATDGAGHGQAVPSTALRPRIKAWIEGHLDDPGIGPESIAAAHYISVRYLHKLFEPEGVSVSEWVRQKRLDHCQRDLLNPAFADQAIVTIASRWGLTNGAHFSRLFRAMYGCSPREYRGRTAVL